MRSGAPSRVGPPSIVWLSAVAAVACAPAFGLQSGRQAAGAPAHVESGSARQKKARRAAAEAVSDRGLALFRKRQYAPAAAAFLKACRIDISDPDPQVHLGLLLEDQRKYAEEERDFRALTALNPSVSSPHYWLGRALLAQKQPRMATVELRDAVIRSPGRWIYHYFLAKSLQAQGLSAAAAAERRAADRLRKAQPVETP